MICTHVLAYAAGYHGTGYTSARKMQGMWGITRHKNSACIISLKFKAIRPVAPDRVSSMSDEEIYSVCVAISSKEHACMSWVSKAVVMTC